MDATKICEMLNAELEIRPAFIQTMVSTLWAVGGVPEFIDVSPLGDDYCTGILGVVNGCLRASNSTHIVGTVTVKDRIKFIPIKAGVTDEEVPTTEEVK